jgi:menaquinol-cytochrome c reductase cytochrome b subunit
MKMPSPPKFLRPSPPRPGKGSNGRNGGNGAPMAEPTVKERAEEATASTVGWLDERTGLSPFLRGFLYRKVPKGTNWYYTLGSATMFAFLSQAVTGVFLAMYYEPDATRAYESASHITNDVFLGEFVRGMHKWGSSVMIILIFLHMGRTFVFGAYKYPRELNWIIGVILVVLTLVMHLYLVAKLGTTAPPWLKAQKKDLAKEEI